MRRPTGPKPLRDRFPSTPHQRRLFADEAGWVCAICGSPIDPIRDRWEIDHEIELWTAQGDRERLAELNQWWNLRLVLKRCHDAKSSAGRTQAKKERRVQAKHSGAHRPKRLVPGGRHDNRKKMPDGRVIDRRTGEQLWPRIRRTE